MSLTIEQLRIGIRYWHDERPGWDQDFHNAFYRDTLPVVRPNAASFNQVWWNQMWRLLQSWSATPRGGGRALMTQRALERLAQLNAAWTSAVVPCLHSDIAATEWSEVAKFPQLVGQIKPVKSPVFTSKFCHFLAPGIFPVVDNRAMGNPFATYEEYFKTAKAEWTGTSAATQNELIGLLASDIGNQLFNGFPMKCKLIELCLIGRFQARSRRKSSPSNCCR